MKTGSKWNSAQRKLACMVLTQTPCAGRGITLLDYISMWLLTAGQRVDYDELYVNHKETP